MQNRKVFSHYVRSLGLIIYLTISSYSYLLAQHTFNFDTYNSNDAAVVPSFDNVPLIAGENYCLEVVGTYSIWPPYDWTAPCATIEPAPMFPSPNGFGTGYVGFDMEHYFSGPDNPRCSLTFPGTSSRIQISLEMFVQFRESQERKKNVFIIHYEYIKNQPKHSFTCGAI